MGFYIRWLAAFIIALVLTALLEPPLAKMFSEIGWHDLSGQVAGGVVNWIVRLFGEAAFPWIASGGIGLGVGVWVHYFASIRDRKKPTKGQVFSGFSSRLHSLRVDIAKMRGHWEGHYTAAHERGRWYPSSAAKYIALESDLGKIKLSLHEFSIACNSEDWDRRSDELFKHVMFLEELSYHGNYDEARRISKEMVDSFKSEFG